MLEEKEGNQTHQAKGNGMNIRDGGHRALALCLSLSEESRICEW